MLTANYQREHFAGMIDNGVEFFAKPGEMDVQCLNLGKVYNSFWEFPEWIRQKVTDDMNKSPLAIKTLKRHWKSLPVIDYPKQYTYCKYGGLDTSPDIDVDGNMGHSEFFDCGRRGKCKSEGKLCCVMKVKHGVLTKTEIEIVRRVVLPDKLIAQELEISSTTVLTHWQNIRRKTGFRTKIELAVFATKKGMIKWIW
ncbi:response regulator transcription factor [Pedobacter gandavensis]|uniref:HTH luxR-type domain-containing protein n=1 Tax=Pedobacter gandavensis TaxID=2679963 RepID=A0ABR6EUA5_9SPHI|nr:LuxR C-terminal-related transcriptional regulator [Pedobacter gandavensis]MBB2148839.1 hypothetical protein [Pedobacter gandavensis]